jgi:hypothetical protein
MNNTRVLTILSLLSILFASFHISDDIVRGFEPGGTSNYIGILIMTVFLYATVMLSGRRWAHVIVMLGSLGGAAVPWIHMGGSGLAGPRVVNAGAVFFWVWTLMAMGVTGIVSVMLTVHGLWSLRRRS